MIAERLKWPDFLSISTTFSTSFNTLVTNSKPFLDRTRFSLTSDNRKDEIVQKVHKCFC